MDLADSIEIWLKPIDQPCDYCEGTGELDCDLPASDGPHIVRVLVDCTCKETA